MLARVKLKGIDGGPHKRWSMWFNSIQREEPYQDLTCHFFPERGSSRVNTGGAWLSSARVLRCWVKSRNERNPCFVLPFKGKLKRLPVTSRRKVRMTSSQHAPYALGDTRATMVRTKRCNPARASQPQKPDLSSDCRLKLACMKSESLVIAGQPYCGEYVPGPCTHRPSHHGSWLCPKSLPQPFRRGMPKAGLVTGVKS